MRKFHLTLSIILGFVMVLGCALSPNAEQLLDQAGPGGGMSQTAPIPGPVPARPPRLRATDTPAAGEPGGWDKVAAKRQADLSQLKTESDELQKLVASLPEQLEKMHNGVLPADLVANLKKIEKLSKHIRSEIQ
jgi:hypothetical protein